MQVLNSIWAFFFSPKPPVEPPPLQHPRKYARTTDPPVDTQQQTLHLPDIRLGLQYPQQLVPMTILGQFRTCRPVQTLCKIFWSWSLVPDPPRVTNDEFRRGGTPITRSRSHYSGQILVALNTEAVWVKIYNAKR
ncbi:hypothetical protein GGX14DRAFT_392518 [Mycena pura]|uniref:Uncharacterized protein n=1 Tax=Mycena pura TaxID=153505 RepID=A0AAD6VJ28_9AGAR|nr:hypothetical protein GGX14DRAFT_392518 [Mycena pura]